MPPRGKAPGLKRGRTARDGTTRWYWMARQVVRDPMGFPDASVPLPVGADMEYVGTYRLAEGRKMWHVFFDHVPMALPAAAPVDEPVDEEGLVLVNEKATTEL